MTIYTRFIHKVDIYSKTATENTAGQMKASWAISAASQACYYVPRNAIVRTKLTYEETEDVSIFMRVDADVDYGSRLVNVTDRYGNIIEAGPLEIREILRQPGFAGKVHHLFITARRVIEP